jgi:hypothetical protein
MPSSPYLHLVVLKIKSSKWAFETFAAIEFGADCATLYVHHLLISLSLTRILAYLPFQPNHPGYVCMSP